MNLTDKIRVLSKKEISVLFLICMGFTNRQILKELDLQEKTLGSRISKIYLKLDINGTDNIEKRNLLLTTYCKTVKELVNKDNLDNWIPQQPPEEEKQKYEIIELENPEPLEKIDEPPSKHEPSEKNLNHLQNLIKNLLTPRSFGYSLWISLFK